MLINFLSENINQWFISLHWTKD